MKVLLSLLLLMCCLLANSQDDYLHCGADELRIKTLLTSPKIAEAIVQRENQLEGFTERYVQQFYESGNRSSVYTIPVVFHVIHNFGIENISDEQILDGLTVLNKTFRKQLADTGSIVAAFKPIHADCEIEFKLAKLDPDGNCTKGINRIASPLTAIGDHSVKSLIQWPTNQYLNVYIVNNAAGLAGHCVWPSDADTIPAWDGIVIGHNYVGTIGTSNYTRSVAFAHECGHYLNLHHIWGGNNVPGFYYLPCGDTINCSIGDDFVADTPPTKGWTTCNLSGSSCGSPVDNVQNTMDYSYCNRMFTVGQKARMQACLNSSIAGRDNLWSAANLIATGVGSTIQLCRADFISDKMVVCESSGNTVTFTNTSFHLYTSQKWSFPGGSPSVSMLTEPVITYNVPGVYDVILTVYNGTDSIVATKTNYIKVLPDNGLPYPFTESFESVVSLDGLDWFQSSMDTLNQWELSTSTAYTGVSCVMLNNFNSTSGTKDELISEVIDLTGSTDMYIRFKYAYAKKDSIGNDDRLQLLITNNCNTTWVQRINLTGTALETAPSTPTAFVPTSLDDWQEAMAAIPTSFLDSDFRFKIVFTSHGGNNLYVDDINIYSTIGIGSAENVERDLRIYPNPTSDEFTVWYTSDNPSTGQLRILNATGEVVYQTDINEQGKQKVKCSTASLESGVYTIVVESSRFKRVQRLVVLK